MTQNPIRRVLSTLSSHDVRFLLMGGQACIFYGAAEFSRDTDIALLAEPENLAKLAAALADLEAERIAVPPFELGYLLRGHAVHFRCRRSDVRGMWLDVMAVMRGVEPFAALWGRRATVVTSDGDQLQLLGLPDLVLAKKTQRDKDWPMIRRLVEAHHAEHESGPSADQVLFWLREARTPPLLVDLAERYPSAAQDCSRHRPCLVRALRGNAKGLELALEEEVSAERLRDRAYWLPLIRELEALR